MSMQYKHMQPLCNNFTIISMNTLQLAINKRHLKKLITRTWYRGCWRDKSESDEVSVITCSPACDPGLMRELETSKSPTCVCSHSYVRPFFVWTSACFSNSLCWASSFCAENKIHVHDFLFMISKPSHLLLIKILSALVLSVVAGLVALFHGSTLPVKPWYKN